MENKDLNICFTVDKAPLEVYKAINNVKAWWTENLTGASEAVGDEFEVQFGDVHYSKQKLTEAVPGERVVWLITGSKLTFVDKQEEWTGTQVIFDISQQGDKTQLSFTHQGLVPEFECFKDCSKGWNFYVDSLYKFITTGKGEPAKKEVIAEKA